LPGVTVDGVAGRDRTIRLRGLGNGYARVLLNGDPVPPGFSLDSLEPSQIERIEILRAPTADLGAQAIAGTINIVLRRATHARHMTRTCSGRSIPQRRSGSRSPICSRRTASTARAFSTRPEPSTCTTSHPRMRQCG
jgi:outer membrane receptor for ferrienterochelin and colicin